MEVWKYHPKPIFRHNFQQKNLFSIWHGYWYWLDKIIRDNSIFDSCYVCKNVCFRVMYIGKVEQILRFWQSKLFALSCKIFGTRSNRVKLYINVCMRLCAQSIVARQLQMRGRTMRWCESHSCVGCCRTKSGRSIAQWHHQCLPSFLFWCPHWHQIPRNQQLTVEQQRELCSNIPHRTPAPPLQPSCIYQGQQAGKNKKGVSTETFRQVWGWIWPGSA